MFAQLDTKSVYSFMDSVVDLNTYVKRAKELGYQSIGLMDRDNLYAPIILPSLQSEMVYVL